MSELLALPLVLSRKRRDEGTDAMNAALMATESESATTTTTCLSKRKVAQPQVEPNADAAASYVLRRMPSSKHSITVFVVLREQQAVRLTHAALNALIGRRELVVSVRVRQRPACDTLSIKRSVCINYVDSVVQLNIDFAPPLSVILPPNQQQVGVFVTLRGDELRGGHGIAASAATEHAYPHELARFDRFEGVSPRRPSASDSNAVAAAVAVAVAGARARARAKGEH
jgi:hypothetical protein